MSRISKSRLLATSAIVGLSIGQVISSAGAQEAFGIHNDQPELLEVVVGEDEEVGGSDIGIYADNGPVTVDNAGEIRGNGTSIGSIESRPSGGIVISQPGSSVTNSGDITGGSNGIATSYFFSEDENDDELPPEPRAANTTVVNTGIIRGDAGNGVALAGGGSVTNNDGLIQGFNGAPGSGINGIGVVITEFPDAIAADATGVGTVTNIDTGIIEGQTFGVVLQGGGTINNEGGRIQATGQFNPAIPGAQVPFGIVMGATPEQTGRSATLNNEGVVLGFFGVLAGGALETTTINNEGIINGAAGAILGQSNGELIVNNGEGAEIASGGNGIQAAISKLTVDNAGTIRSDSQNGINILTADAAITNSGTIRGGQFGIVTNAQPATPQGPGAFIAANTAVTNSGTILGNNNDGVRLVGGGAVVNSGVISGLNNAQSDGVNMYAYDGQDPATYVSSVTNSAEGQITGVRAGVALSSGGTVDNAGAIDGNGLGVLIQNGEAPLTGAITNSGTINGLAGDGIVGFGNLESFSVANSGAIAGAAGDGVYASINNGTTVIENAEDGTITGAASGVHAELGGLDLTNAGTIHGDGVNPGFDAPPDAGVTISGGPSSVVNSGSITGNRFGITTANYFNPATGQLQGLATGTTVVNSGTIYGYNDDGVRLIGGGSVTNSGEIGGQIDAFADGVSMFAYTDQANEDYSALVTNETEGRIIGVRFGVILSGGGDVVNDGEILGASGGVYVQGTALNTDPNEERSGLTASIVNRGTITGLGDFGGTGTEGYGVGFGSDMSTATLVNSGTISSEFAEGVSHGSLADLSVTNEDGGVITGATSGIYSGAGGTLTVDNAGTIRGNGTYDGFAAPPDAGITIGTAASSVTNSGTISGASAGITTASLFDEEAGTLVGLAIGTQVTNSGTILGEGNDGVRLIGGGTVTNSGSIRGEGTTFSDGISMYAFTDQAKEDFGASVVNAEGGDISGTRFGIILSGGGAVENGGDITGVDGGMFIQGTAINTDPGEDRSGLTASLVNSGTITGTRDDGLNGYGVGFGSDLSTATLDNSGTITSVAGAGVFHGTLGDVTINNSASGVIEGEAYGVFASGEGTLDLINAGTIQSAGTGIESTAAATSLVNSGTITGGNGVAALFGAFDDMVTLKTGSSISGLVDAGDGVDTLTLDGDILELTEAQQLTAASGFETLNVAAGYWSTSGFVGEFGNVAVAEGGALQVNEVDLGGGDTSSPILTSTVRTDGLLVLNFGTDETVSALDELTIDGAGQLQLIGDAVFTVDTANIAHTGGTVISNGGLVLTGVLQGDVKTEGDGFFELGAGGTEGSFAGNIVNDGRFVFNRSDDYDFLGAFSGSGTLDKKGDGVLAFMGDYAFQGVTNILGGSVRIGGIIDPETNFDLGEGGTLDITGNDQTIGGLEGDEGASVVIGDNQLTVAQSGNTEFGGDISGGGSLVKEGEGTLNLTGDSSYTGPTAVNGGTLAVNGSIVSPVTVNSGGTLGGNGSVGSTTVGDGGTLAPGNSIGQLTVNGNLAFAAGSTYEVEVNAAGEADRLDATGAVTIDSTASVAVLAENGEYNGRTDYVILTGAGGITGTFGTVTSDLAFLDPLLRYSMNSVTLSLYRNDIDFADIAIGFNQTSVATAVQALGVDNPLYEAVLVQNAATAQASFGDLSGEILASSLSGLTDDSRHLRNSLMGMKAPAEGGAFVWGSAFGSWGDFDANRGNFAMDTDHKGLIAGVGIGGNGFAAALSAGIGSSDFRFDGRNDRAEVDSKYLAAHATYGGGEGLRGTVGVSYAWHDIDTSRGIAGAPLAQTLTSKRDADTLQIFGEIGYDFVTGNMAVTPFARLAHVDTGSDAFAETGGNAALTVGKADQKTTFFSLGARAQFNAGKPGFQPYVSAAWNRASGDRGAPIVSRFTAGGPAFEILGTVIPKNSAEVEAGFEFTSGLFRLGAAYTGTLASDRNAHGARVTARIAF
ncbi:autotransporter domain-containing protein [Sphingopyxis sp. JAI128]|uniref:autotransporter domain-containing protein n=1 Tax=Sphingopyxis sp. JAI128 TaxID=2723066 RepID=UPI001618373A|nr:autotransporter domain-containing protein [Sphingopyxis sp. JAI128]MBB6425178.1 autotransporter-associated beta strand protein [Sphingopyxis sp. JAI128]